MATASSTATPTAASSANTYTLQALARIEPDSTEALYAYAKTAHKITELLALELDTTQRLIVSLIGGSGMRRNMFGINMRASARRATRRLRKAADLAESASRELSRFPRDYEKEFEALVHPGADGKPAWTFAENGKRSSR